jgi:hypothetical protein
VSKKFITLNVGSGLDNFKMINEKIFKRITKTIPKIPVERCKEVKSPFTQEELKSFFNYGQDGELYWRISVADHVKIGDKASHVSFRGKKRNPFKRTYIKGKGYITARLIFLMFHGYTPEYVSFIDGNPLNTKFYNLRSATSSQVNFGRKTEGKGVFFDKGKWRSTICFNHTRYYLGAYFTQEEAQEAYNLAAKRLCKEFARTEKV